MKLSRQLSSALPPLWHPRYLWLRYMLVGHKTLVDIVQTKYQLRPWRRLLSYSWNGIIWKRVIMSIETIWAPCLDWQHCSWTWQCAGESYQWNYSWSDAPFGFVPIYLLVNGFGGRDFASEKEWTWRDLNASTSINHTYEWCENMIWYSTIVFPLNVVKKFHSTYFLVTSKSLCQRKPS